MAKRFESEESPQAQALYAVLDEDERKIVHAVIAHIAAADLPPAHSLFIQRSVLEHLLAEVRAGRRIAFLIDDTTAYAETAIAEIGEALRQQRHIGTLMSGIALCAIVLLITSVVGLWRGMADGIALTDCTATLNVGHVICLIAILAGARFFVMGDKSSQYNDLKRARRRSILVGTFFTIALIALIVAFVVKLPVVLSVPAVYLIAASLVLIALWKLSAKL